MMPNETKRVYSKLLNSIRLLNTTWSQYVILFGDSSTIECMNRIAPFHFHELQRILAQDAVLRICRLMDPPQSKVNKKIIKDNCSLEQIRLAGNKKLDALLAKAKLLAKSLKVWRDKHFAHSDLETMEGAVPLPSLTRKKIELAISSINEFMSLVSNEYFPEAQHTYVMHPIGGAESLVDALKEVCEARAEKRKRLGQL